MKRLGAVSVLLATILAACSSTEADWQKATAADTVAAYQDFLMQHPNGQQADEARSRIRARQDDQAWMDAMSADTEASFRQYARLEPHGSHLGEASARITGFERAAAWQSASGVGTTSALQAFLEQYPTGAQSDEARAQLERLNHPYRVQLAGSYRSARQAERAGARFKVRFAGLLHDVVVAPPTPPSRMIHLRSAPMSEEEAKSACATLRRRHEGCEVVKG